MSGSDDSEKPSLPTWQQAQSSNTGAAASRASRASTVSSTGTAAGRSSQQSDSKEGAGSHEGAQRRKHLLEKASKFLGDPSIKDATRERKASFLVSKGLTRSETEELLRAAEKQEQQRTLSTQKGDPQVSRSSPWEEPAGEQAPVARDIPPIVTYPEFLAQPSKPPPLITISRLLNTAYITSAAAASLYGLSKFVVQPMTEALTAARHDLCSQTISELEYLNQRLGDLVSVDPSKLPKKDQSPSSVLEDDDFSSSSDPTELFHRDFGTQTSPILSRRPSQSSETNSLSPQSTLDMQQSRLQAITSQLRDLQVNALSSTSTSESLTGSVRDLSNYLTDLRFQQTFGSSSVYGSAFGERRSGTPTGGKDDAAEAVKADIRSVKGVLLSARNFPLAGRGAMWRKTED